VEGEDVVADGVLSRFTFEPVLMGWPFVVGAAAGVGLGEASVVGIGTEAIFCA
jgi:tetrahydrodipicolinate N-succinyltransferase